jgi:hypothetical protein
MKMPSKEVIVAAFRSKGLATYPYAIDVVNDTKIKVKFHKLGKSATAGDDERKLKDIAQEIGASASGSARPEDGIAFFVFGKYKPIAEATAPDEPVEDESPSDVEAVNGEQAVQIIDFILNTEDIDDEKFHEFVEGELGLEAHDAESVVYKVFQQVMLDMAEEEGQFGDPVVTSQDDFHYGDEDDMQPIEEGDIRMQRANGANRFAEIKDEIKELLREAIGIVRDNRDSVSEDRAKAYWYAHITMALDDDHGYLGSGSYTMQDTAEELEKFADGGPHDEDPQEGDMSHSDPDN